MVFVNGKKEKENDFEDSLKQLFEEADKTPHAEKIAIVDYLCCILEGLGEKISLRLEELFLEVLNVKERIDKQSGRSIIILFDMGYFLQPAIAWLTFLWLTSVSLQLRIQMEPWTYSMPRGEMIKKMVSMKN